MIMVKPIFSFIRVDFSKKLSPQLFKMENTLVLFHSTADLALFKEQGLPKILITHECPSPRKSLVKGERLIRHEERPEQF